MPPAVIPSCTLRIGARSFGPSCPQIPLSALPTADVFSPKGGNQTEFFPVEDFSEDCLTLNVWTPADSSAVGLPVIVWFFGGGFVQGGAHSLYFDAAPWVQRTQAHIVVSVNFRSNIFGFPNAAGLDEQNLGLLDQRAALEWIRANIAAFGGDTARIVGWGESAGGIAADFLNFAFPNDPIVSGVVLSSGTALFPQAATQTTDTTHANFAQVATELGCTANATQLACMRSLSWESIETVLANSTLKFIPVPDERIVFANYSAQYSAGAIARVPAMIGTNQHELNAEIPANETFSDISTNTTFLCTAAGTAQLREARGLTTYRYRYDGNFPDISSPKFPGAYHASELPLLFGTMGRFHGVATAYENEVSMKMQDLWLAFAKDPELGLQGLGWDSFSAGKAVLLGGAETPMKAINVQDLDTISEACLVNF
ncbi:Alpha/Beta hydrolase protein [Mycena crocata]|nr:Alpha/Beta hydrolase protein [Mycena crocata]